MLEPVIAVQVTTPLEHVGVCIGDLNQRRGMVRRQEQVGNAGVIHAMVPMRDPLGYIGG